MVPGAPQVEAGVHEPAVDFHVHGTGHGEAAHVLVVTAAGAGTLLHGVPPYVAGAAAHVSVNVPVVPHAVAEHVVPGVTV